MVRVGQHSTWGLSSLMLMTMAVCCSPEKKSASPSGGAPVADDNGTDEGDTDSDAEGDADGTDGTDGPAAGFDLCKDGIKVAKLTGFDTYIEALCDGSKPKIDALRDDEVVYKGGEARIYKDDPKKGELSTSIRIFTSTLVDSKVNDYWALMQLQLKKSDIYRGKYDYDSAVTLSEIKVDTNKVAFRYANFTNDGGGVDYSATTRFVVLKDGQAYMSATKLDESHDTMTALTGLIIINKKSSTKTEVFTMSDQTYSHQANQGDSAENQAIQAAEAEQVRMFENAKKASLAPALLK